MKKSFLIIVIIIILAISLVAYFLLPQKAIAPVTNQTNNIASTSDNLPSSSNTGQQNVNSFQAPLDRAAERITKKTFGMYITPQTSPVQPERFTGYHTGVDWEIFPQELNTVVDIKAVCSGKLVLKESASGYGGVAVELCQLNGQPITVIYGHLKSASINLSVGDNITAGDIIGTLGANKSIETDGERKHLHLGFHLGSDINIRGYVSSQSELANWLDPCLYVCSN